MASITRRAHSARARRREELRERMMGTVVALLEEGEPFTRLSVERIVSEAGISRSTFYVYFEDKGDLLRELTTHATAQMLAASRAWWDQATPVTRESIERGMASMVETYRHLSTLMAAMVDASSYDLGVHAVFQRMVETGERELAEHLRAGQHAGVVRFDIDARRTASWLAWMIERGLYQLIRPADDAEARRLTAVLTDVVWSAAYERPSR